MGRQWNLTLVFLMTSLPKIQFNEQYFHQFQSMNDEKVKRFLQEKQQDFQWIMRGIEQRKKRLLRVSAENIEKQLEFFYPVLDHLKPMTMKEVADELDIHESTVSRR